MCKINQMEYESFLRSCFWLLMLWIQIICSTGISLNLYSTNPIYHMFDLLLFFLFHFKHWLFFKESEMICIHHLNGCKSTLRHLFFKKTLRKNGSKNAAIGHKNAALERFGLRPRFLRPRFITRPKTWDYRPGRSKAALFEPRPKTRSYSRGKNAASDRPGLSTIWP